MTCPRRRLTLPTTARGVNGDGFPPTVCPATRPSRRTRRVRDRIRRPDLRHAGSRRRRPGPRRAGAPSSSRGCRLRRSDRRRRGHLVPDRSPAARPSCRVRAGPGRASRRLDVVHRGSPLDRRSVRRGGRRVWPRTSRGGALASGARGARRTRGIRAGDPAEDPASGVARAVDRRAGSIGAACAPASSSRSKRSRSRQTGTSTSRRRASRPSRTKRSWRRIGCRRSIRISAIPNWRHRS